MKYKDLQNKVHEIDPAFAHLLPVGCVEITGEEAAQLLAPTPQQLALIVSAGNYKQVIRNRAKNLPAIEAVLLLKTIGE